MSDPILDQLKKRREAIIKKLAEIDSEPGHNLNTPDVKTTDGGTTLAKTAYIKRLEDSLKEVDDQIIRHRKIMAALDAGSGEPFETHTPIG